MLRYGSLLPMASNAILPLLTFISYFFCTRLLVLIESYLNRHFFACCVFIIHFNSGSIWHHECSFSEQIIENVHAMAWKIYAATKIVIFLHTKTLQHSIITVKMDESDK